MIGSFVSLAVSAALLPSNSIAAFRAGDAGFSLKTNAGQTWVYGDSWNAGAFIRNAMTLDDVFTGTVKGSPAIPSANWIWPGAPFEMSNGDIAMYAAELTTVKTKRGAWAFQILGGLRTQFSPSDATTATVSRMPKSSILWSAAATKDPDTDQQYVYGIDSRHSAHAGRVNSDGSVTDVGNMGGTISGQFTVLQDPADGSWWMVGNLPFLSRRVVAYPLSGPAGKVTGSGLKLITLPNPGTTRFVYAATVHPELNGLLTWAVNGIGSGTPYGLQRQAGFWPLALHFVKSAAGIPLAGVQAHESISSGSGSSVKLWDSGRQGELQGQMDAETSSDTAETWLGPELTGLTAGISSNASAAQVWGFGDWSTSLFPNL